MIKKKLDNALAENQTMQRIIAEAKGNEDKGEENEKLKQLLNEFEVKVELNAKELKAAQDEYNSKEVALLQRIKCLENTKENLPINIEDIKRINNPAEDLAAPYNNNTLNEILKAGKKYLDCIDTLNIKLLSTTEKVNFLHRLVTKLIRKTEDEEEKYHKLLDLHNQLFQLNSNREEIYHPQKIFELDEENKFLGNKIENLTKQFEYFSFV